MERDIVKLGGSPKEKRDKGHVLGRNWETEKRQEKNASRSAGSHTRGLRRGMEYYDPKKTH